LARSRIAPRPKKTTETSYTTEPSVKLAADTTVATPKRASRYRPWAELLKRTFGVDVLQCSKCQGRMKLVAMLTKQESILRYLASIGEPTNVPTRSPRPESNAPPYWKSKVLRLKAMDDAA
jgi:hypothetical protein